jgi:ankyrin repeat protein
MLPQIYCDLLVQDVNKEYECSQTTSSTGFTPLMKLVMLTNEHPFLNEYISRHVDIINSKNTKGWTALMLACKNSNRTSSLDTIKILLKYGADVNLQSYNDRTALIYAAGCSNFDSSVETVRLLINNGADVNISGDDGWTALMHASRYSNADEDSNLETVRILLDSGSNINLKNLGGFTALRLAIEDTDSGSKLETVKMLLEYGSDINSKSHDGWTVLMSTCRYFSLNNNLLARLLLEYEPDVNIINAAGWTALMHAARYASTESNIEIVKLLIDNNANINLKNNDNCTALMLACVASNNLNTVRLLLKNGAIVNKPAIYYVKYLPTCLEYIEKSDRVVDSKFNILCKQCCKNKATYIGLPCNHVIYCSICYYINYDSKCKICFKNILSLEKLFF